MRFVLLVLFTKKYWKWSKSPGNRGAFQKARSSLEINNSDMGVLKNARINKSNKKDLMGDVGCA